MPLNRLDYGLLYVLIIALGHFHPHSNLSHKGFSAVAPGFSLYCYYVVCFIKCHSMPSRLQLHLVSGASLLALRTTGRSGRSPWMALGTVQGCRLDCETRGHGPCAFVYWPSIGLSSTGPTGPVIASRHTSYHSKPAAGGTQ